MFTVTTQIVQKYTQLKYKKSIKHVHSLPSRKPSGTVLCLYIYTPTHPKCQLLFILPKSLWILSDVYRFAEYYRNNWFRNSPHFVWANKQKNHASGLLVRYRHTMPYSNCRVLMMLRRDYHHISRIPYLLKNREYYSYPAGYLRHSFLLFRIKC